MSHKNITANSRSTRQFDFVEDEIKICTSPGKLVDTILWIVLNFIVGENVCQELRQGRTTQRPSSHRVI